MIDVNFDFTSDSPHYWDNFWNDSVLGGGGSDPDVASKTLQCYHKMLWSKPLPNGAIMQLESGQGKNYLTWKDFRFGSDSILASFRYVRYRHMLEQVSQYLPNYHSYIENFLHKAYSIGGSIIFPKTNSFNCARGTNTSIKDRWDLSLECIRRYYNNEESPLSPNLQKNQEFFDLFVDFKGYVDFFFLQDCVTEDYSTVIKWIDHTDFTANPLPQTVDEYVRWIEKQMEFVQKRNQRIKESLGQ